MFGAYAMAGTGSYTKIDGFAILPVLSFAMALTTFVGQNKGAQEYERIKKRGTYWNFDQLWDHFDTDNHYCFYNPVFIKNFFIKFPSN